MDAGADVFSHNIETVPRLYSVIRPGFDYGRSLEVLRFASSRGNVVSKSGFMVGLGENIEDVQRLMRDIKETGCPLLTIGQYLKPRSSHYEVRDYVSPEAFKYLEEEALALGFKKVKSGPFVRSSYRAHELFFNNNFDSQHR